jgi:hypothetical protein
MVIGVPMAYHPAQILDIAHFETMSASDARQLTISGAAAAMI